MFNFLFWWFRSHLFIFTALFCWTFFSNVYVCWYSSLDINAHLLKEWDKKCSIWKIPTTGKSYFRAQSCIERNYWFAQTAWYIHTSAAWHRQGGSHTKSLACFHDHILLQWWFGNHCNIRFDPIPVKVICANLLKDHYVQVPWKYIKVCVDTVTFFFKNLKEKGHWPLDDLWPQVCWGHMCDSTQG